jgi:hypothetical protein
MAYHRLPGLRPQQSARAEYRGCDISAWRVGPRTTGFRLTKGREELLCGYSDQPISARRLVRLLRRNVDELLTITAAATNVA